MSRTIDIPDVETITHMDDSQFRLFMAICMTNYHARQREQNGDIKALRAVAEKQDLRCRYNWIFYVFLVLFLLPESAPPAIAALKNILSLIFR